MKAYYLLVALFLVSLASLSFAEQQTTLFQSNERTGETEKSRNAVRDTCFTATEYLGCYDNTVQLLSATTAYPLDGDGEDAPDGCACVCGTQGYLYAGITEIDQCFCGNSYDTTVDTDPADCFTCPDDNTTFCGSGLDQSLMSIYKTSIGCDITCDTGETCSALTNSDGTPFYWCTPDCDFVVTIDAPAPCGGSTATVTITTTGGSTYNTYYNYSMDGGEYLMKTIGTPEVLSLTPGSFHSFHFINILSCSKTVNLTIPVSSEPIQDAAPLLVFDVSTMNLDIMWYHLLYPSETGQVSLDKYTVEYSFSCPNSTAALSWTASDATSSADSKSVAFEYGMQYNARVSSTNCVGQSPVSDVATSIAPSSPYTPAITQILPSQGIPTTGGTISVYGQNLLGTVALLVDGVPCTGSAVSSGLITCAVGAGVGAHPVQIQTSFNYPCQQMNSTAVSFSYLIPNVTSTSVLSNRGGSLIIDGSNFGVLATPAVVTISGSSCSSCAVSTAHTEITCSGCPAGAGPSHDMVVSIGGLQSSTYSFAYAECSPMCIFGDCVATNTCSCETGYGSADCSQVNLCESTKSVFSASTCGDCSTGGVCCVLN